MAPPPNKANLGSARRFVPDGLKSFSAWSFPIIVPNRNAHATALAPNSQRIGGSGTAGRAASGVMVTLLVAVPAGRYIPDEEFIRQRNLWYRAVYRNDSAAWVTNGSMLDVLMMTAYWVRLSIRKSSLPRPSMKLHASVAACCM